jgi:hypothetical protein
MKLFKIYLLLFALVLAFVGISRLFNPQYEVRESIVVQKPLPEVFGYLTNLPQWEQWSLWNKDADSTLLFFYNSKQGVQGAKQYFSGDLVGKGFIEITASKPDTAFAYRMYMREGELTANGVFHLRAIDSMQTEISWSDTGNVGNNPLKRYLIPVVTKNTAESFAQGLLRIKAQLEQ